MGFCLFSSDKGEKVDRGTCEKSRTANSIHVDLRSDVTDYFSVKCECINSSELLTMGVRSRSGSFTVGDTEEGRPELGPGADCSEVRGGVSDVDNVLKVEPA